MRQAVILAGGKGTRLKERLNGRPKPLIDIEGVPLLERQIALCKRYGIREILILVNHAADQIVAFCAAHNNWGLKIECIDDGEPRGTAGAVLHVFDRLADETLVLYGDTMLEVNFRRFIDFHRRNNADATLFLHPNDHPHDSDLVELGEDDNIAAFHPYPHQPDSFYANLVNAALYVVKKSALEPWRDETGPRDFGKDLFPAMLARGQKLAGYNSPEYIKDCGTPDRLDKVSTDFRSGRIARASLDVPQAAVFLDRDGTLNRDNGYIAKTEAFELIDGTATAVKRLNRAEYRTVVVTNQPVIARGEATVADLRHIHDKMETLLGREGAFLDRIYYCPHHPDRGFAGEVPELKRVCDCRKPAIGLIRQAQADLNIDLARSWLIGDTTTDMLAAKRAGVGSILVETGAAGLDRKYAATADFVMPNLAAAVGFVLDEYPRLVRWLAGWAKDFTPGSTVLIGGLSRSGKTTVSNALLRTLALMGRQTVLLSLDRWLFSAPDRGPSVLGRYDLPAIRKIVASVANRNGLLHLNLPAYDRLNRKRIDEAETVTIYPDDIVIFEGTVALSFEADMGKNTRTLHVETPEDCRLRRFLHEYMLRGSSEEEARKLYISRQNDETPVVLKFATAAQKCLSLPLVESSISSMPLMKGA